MPHTLLVRPDRPLVGQIDAEARFARFPPDYTIKGMFMSRMAGLAGRDLLEELRPRIRSWPTGGRYFPFSDYPQVDYSRLTYAVALARRATLEPLEAMRQLARDDLGTFTRSRVGAIMVGLAGSAEDVLLRSADMYAASLKGGKVHARRLPDGRIELDYRSFHGWVDSYAVGTVESLAGYFGKAVEIEIELHTEVDATYRVRLL